jgi:Ca2+-binding RTX toxin-like protein
MMKRIFLLLTTMALGVLMVSSVALALNQIQCPNGTDASFPVTCIGTDGDDSMSGTKQHDNMNGLAGNDTLNGYGGSDTLTGDAETGTLGNDTLNGGGRNDELGDRFGTNTLIGGAGSDTFYADYANHPVYPYDEISEISGGSGNDYVYAADGAIDTINCGAGNEDWVDFDPGLDVVRNCEIDGNNNPL